MGYGISGVVLLVIVHGLWAYFHFRVIHTMKPAVRVEELTVKTRAQREYCENCGLPFIGQSKHSCPHCKTSPLCGNCIQDINHECVEDRRNEFARGFRGHNKAVA